MEATVAPFDVTTLTAASSLDEVRGAMRALLRPRGFTASALGGFIPTREGGRPFFYYRDWPDDWLALYTRENFAAHDFGVAEARLRFQPFTWTQAKAERELSIGEKRVWQAALDHGWKNGVNVPIHGPAGYFGLAAFAATHDDISPAQVDQIASLARTAHQRCREISGEAGALQLRASLSSRELECLRWVAAGLSDPEIGARLNLSAQTVKGYVDEARRKLGARTRAQALLIAYTAGLV